MLENSIMKIAVIVLLSSILLKTSRADGCVTVFEKSQKAYVGWPVTLNCEDAYLIFYGHEDYYYDYFYYGDINVTCIISVPESSAVLLNDTEIDEDISDLTYTFNVSNSSPTQYEIRIETPDGNCVLEKLRLNVTNLTDYACNEVPKSNINLIEAEVSQEEPYTMLCEQKYAYKDDVPGLNVRDYEVTWYYNCETTLPPNVTVNDEQLRIPSADYRHHPGSYSCSIRQNGQTRFIMFFDYCVKPRRWSPIVQLSCPEELKYRVGQNISMNCDVNIGSASRDSTRYTMNFNRLLPNGSIDMSKDNISCTANLGGGRTPAPDERVSCEFSYGKNATDDFKCFNEIPTQQEWETEKNKTLTTLHMTYEMTNVQKTDFGTFQSFIKNEFSGMNDTDITIVSEIIGDPKRTIQRIGIAIGCVLGVVLIAVLCFIFLIEIQWVWKHYFASYDTDVRAYGAYFTYFWSNEHQPNPMYNNLIESIGRELKMLNAPIYDPHHNPAVFEWNTENIQRVQQKCDRIIIILTAEYLNEAETSFEIYNNFLQSSFIFIKTPSVDEVIKNMQEERRHGIKAALRRNHVIEWPGEKLSGRCKRRLELAMPKRKAVNPAYENGNGEVVYENGEAIIHHNGHNNAV